MWGWGTLWLHVKLEDDPAALSGFTWHLQPTKRNLMCVRRLWFSSDFTGGVKKKTQWMDANKNPPSTWVFTVSHRSAGETKGRSPGGGKQRAGNLLSFDISQGLKLSHTHTHTVDAYPGSSSPHSLFSLLYSGFSAAWWDSINRDNTVRLKTCWI